MAIMIPDNPADDEFNHSYGEFEVYEALKKLPNNFYIFHSIHWNRPNRRGREWGEADFTIFDINRGVLVVEVKSGYIERQNGEWIQTNTQTNQSNCMKDPMNQAAKSKYCYIDLLEENDISCWVDCVVWFPTCTETSLYGKMPPNYQRGNTFMRSDLMDPISAINRAFDFYGVRTNSLDPALSKNIVEILSPSFHIVQSLSASMAEQTYHFTRLTREQAYLLDYLDEQKTAVIQGGAGTGKTFLAIEKAKRFQHEGKRVLFLCFNRLLLQHFREKYGHDLPGVDFHNLMSLTHKKLGYFTGDQDINAYLENYNEYGWNYDAIIIDEGQDIAEDHLLLLSLIAEETCKIFYIFLDKYQLVQQRNNFEWLNNIECRLVLSTNCRNTKSIATTANRVVRTDKIKMRRNVEGVKPNFFFCHSKERALENLVAIIKRYVSNNIALNKIAILSMKTEDDSICSDISKIMSYPITDKSRENAILFTTCRKFKGLESDIVILVDIDKKSFSDEQTRRLFYVGASRAIHFLEILCVVDNQEELAMAYSFTENVKNARLTLSKELKIKVCE